MSRRRSVAFIPVALGALLGALGAVSVSAAPPVGTDASEVTHWNQVAASTLAAVPGRTAVRRRIPDQHGHGAGRRVRRSQRDRAGAASVVSAPKRAGAKASIDAAVTTAAYDVLSDLVSTAPATVPFPGRAGLLTTLAIGACDGIPRRDQRWRQEEAGHRDWARGGQGNARRESGRRTIRAVPVGREHRRRKVGAAHQSDNDAADPRSDPMGGHREAVPHRNLVAVPQRATARAEQRSSGPTEYNEVKSPRPNHRLDAG